MVISVTGGKTMIEPNLEIPGELRQLAQRAVDQVEQVFGLFFDAARRSPAATTTSAAQLTKQVLAFSEENLKTSFEHARRLASTASLEEIATAQSELVKRQIGAAEHHIRELAQQTGSKEQT